METKFSGKKNFSNVSFIFHKLISDISFSKCFFESRAHRTIFQNVFPKFFLVSLHFDVYCAICCMFVVFT